MLEVKKYDHLAKSYTLKSSPKFTCYTTNTGSDAGADPGGARGPGPPDHQK